VQGLVTRRTNKLNSPELKHVFETHDVVLLTETWTNDTCMSNLHVNNFKCFFLNRTEIKKTSKRSSGGLIVYIRDQYVANDTLVFTSCDDLLCIRIEGSIFNLESDLYFCLSYSTR